MYLGIFAMFLISCFIKKKNNLIFHRENIDHKKIFDRNREKIRLHFAASVKSAFTMGNSNRGLPRIEIRDASNTGILALSTNKKILSPNRSKSSLIHAGTSPNQMRNAS